MNLVGGDDQNAGTNGRPNAVVVRVYQLSARTNFDRAAPASLWRDDAGALGNELLTKREVTLVPSANEKLSVSLGDQTRFVAIAADFFNPDPNNWRGILPVASVKKKVVVHVGKTGLTVQ